MTPLTPTVITLFILLAAVAVMDITTHRIPNWITVSALVLAFLLNFLSAGPFGLFTSAAGMAVCLAVFLPLYLTGSFGAGDVKALAAVGALLGPINAIFAVIGTLLAGLCVGLFVFAFAAGPAALRERLHRWSLGAYVLYTTGQITPSSTPTHHATMRAAATRRFPYGLAIACGTVASLIWTAHHG